VNVEPQRAKFHPLRANVRPLNTNTIFLCCTIR
jgi:hypothetical protein